MKGLVLSGGKGKRLRPITHTSAKQLIPVANKPILFYGIEMLAEAGIRDVGIVVGYTREEVMETVGDGSRWGIKVTYIHQPEPLGLAHAVLVSEDFLGDEPFIMYLGDNILKQPLSELIEEFEEEKPDALILLARVPNPGDFGVAELDGKRIVRLVEKPKTPPSDYALVGVYLFSSRIFEAARNIKPSARGELEITDAIQWLIDNGFYVRAKVTSGWWKDTGKPDDLIEANRLILEDIPRNIRGEVVDSEVRGRVQIGEGTLIKDSVIKGPVVIGDNVRVVNSFIGPFTSIYHDAVIEGTEIEDSVILKGVRIKDVPGRIEGSILGNETVLLRRDRKPRSLRLVLGDHSIVELQ